MDEAANTPKMVKRIISLVLTFSGETVVSVAGVVISPLSPSPDASKPINSFKWRNMTAKVLVSTS
jgi:hypothetical protein